MLFLKSVYPVSAAAKTSRRIKLRIEDTVIVITGGASGIGEACARRLVEAGAKGVGILDMDAARGERVAAELGDKVTFAHVDITEEAAVNAAIAAIESKHGAIGAVISAAGIAGPAKLIGRNGPIEMAKFDRVVKVNLYGTLHLMRACVPSMQRRDANADGERGVVINVASGAAYEGQIGQLAYAASKAAIVGMTMPLMRELAATGVRVVCVSPGAFETPIYEQMPAATKQGIIDKFLFPKRLGHPAEFAAFAEELIRNPMHNGRDYRFDAGNILMPQ